MKQKYLVLPASQVIPAMRIVLNLDSLGLRGLMMALYLDKDINILSIVILDNIIIKVIMKQTLLITTFYFLAAKAAQ